MSTKMVSMDINVEKNSFFAAAAKEYFNHQFALTITLDVILDEHAIIGASICPREAAMTMLSALNVVTFIGCAIWPRFATIAMLLIFFPIASVLGAIKMTVDAEAVGLVILPASIVDVAICMDQSAHSIGFTVDPVALVHGAIGPDLSAFALTDLCTAHPLSLILCSIFKHDVLSLFAICTGAFEILILIVERTELLTHFLKTKNNQDRVSYRKNISY
jgi:uncharacterized Tic20 family protein